MTTILALDLATVTGFARGRPGAAPTFGSVNFDAKGGGSDNAIFAAALRWLSDAIAKPATPDLIVLEAMLPPQALKGKTSRAVRDRLAGLHGIVRAVAYCRGVYRIETAAVGDVRSHFVGDRGLSRAAAKAEVARTCARLGWPVTDDDQADACALWSYACGRIDPVTALRVSPLFARGIAI